MARDGLRRFSIDREGIFTDSNLGTVQHFGVSVSEWGNGMENNCLNSGDDAANLNTCSLGLHFFLCSFASAWPQSLNFFLISTLPPHFISHLTHMNISKRLSSKWSWPKILHPVMKPNHLLGRAFLNSANISN